MSLKVYTPICKLESSKVKWNIRVRAQTVWKGITRETNEYRGTNIIFLDDSNCRIHAFVSSKISDLFENVLTEGDIFIVQNFVVKQYRGDETNRCLRNEKHIFFADFTKVEKDNTNLMPIPPYSFDLWDLGDLERFETQKSFLCDVVGILNSDLNIRHYVNESNQEKTQLKFSITDGRSCRKVTFFDSFAEDVGSMLNTEMVKPLVIIIVCAKVNKYEGELYLTNYPATRVHINAKHYSVLQLRNKALEPSFILKPKCDDAEDDIIELFAVDQLLANKEPSLIGKNIRARLTIKRVEEEFRWYVYVCNSCGRELTTVDGRYKCVLCDRNIPFPERRFKVNTLCADDTGVVAVTFADREIRRITGKTVFELQLDETQNVGNGQIPPLLKAIENFEYFVTLIVSEENVLKGSHVYDAYDISDRVDSAVTMKCYQESDSETEDASTDIDIESSDTGPTSETPSTDKSNPKVRYRETEETAEEIDDENVPLNKFKTLKTEKN